MRLETTSIEKLYSIMRLFTVALTFRVFLAVRSQFFSPVLQYCYSNQNSSCDYDFKKISESGLEFGKIDRSVLTLGNYEFLQLRCKANYPVRWLAHKPLGAVHYMPQRETTSYSPNSLEYVEQIRIALKSVHSNLFRCESFSNDGLFSDVYLNSSALSGSKSPLLFESGLTYFEITHGKPSEYLVFPCVATLHRSETQAKLVQLSRQSQGLQVSANCALCMCAANSDCPNRTFPCNSTNVCGFKSLKWQRRVMSVSEENDDLYSCAGDFECSRCAIKRHLNRVQSQVRDCNGDGILSCDDYARTYLVGNKECNQNLSSGYQRFYSRFQECLLQANESIKIPKTDPEFDPRIGFRVKSISPNFESLYVCSSFQSIHYVIPLSTRWKTKASLYYDSKGNGTPAIHCDPEGANVKNIRLRVRTCNSITGCDLKYRHISPVVFVVEKSENSEKDLPLPYNDTHGAATSTTHGYVQCTARYRISTQPDVIGYVSEADYMFKGLDNKKYLFSGLDFPNEGVISFQTSDNEMRPNVLNKLECKISTFVLLPFIVFEVQYANEEQPSKQITLREKGIELVLTESEIDPVRSWQLYLNITESMTTITCRAPFITNHNWASAEIPVNITVVPPASQRLSEPTNEPPFNIYMIIGIAAGVILTFMVLLLIVWRKYLKSKAMIRNLTEEEMEEFLNGGRNQGADEESLVIESLGFSQEMVIQKESLKICDEVLGSGEFGIVHKGEFEDQIVAVKSCKGNTDVEYFKAFLKELKVMAFIGRHENVVLFHGAVIENIREGICPAVMEFCPFGNLNSYLRKHSGTYTERLPSPDIVHQACNANETAVILNQSILISFCKQIATGMEFLAGKRVIHADLATRNVLVFSNNVVKVTDFGLSRKLYNCANYTRTKQVPLPWRWMALESLRFYQFSTQSDVWGFGVTIWEIFSLSQIPFSGLSWSGDFTQEIESGLRLSKPQHSSVEIYDFMKKCWENEPGSRPTFTECKAFFINLEWSVHRNDNIYGMLSES